MIEPSSKQAGTPDHFYYHALGQFISTFSVTEAILRIALRHFAKVNDSTGKAVFSGVRVDTAMSLINRLLEVRKPRNTQLQKDMTRIFTQLGIINGVRNDIVHYGSDVIGEERVVSNRLVALTTARLRETPVSPDILDQMTHDLMTIGVRVAYNMRPSAAIPDAVREPWLYKPRAPSPRRKRHRNKPRSQQRQPRSSQT
jgi:hypothetical protein